MPPHISGTCGTHPQSHETGHAHHAAIAFRHSALLVHTQHVRERRASRHESAHVPSADEVHGDARMLTVRKATDRGLSRRDWLESWHTFSFGDYYDPEFLGFGPLRVINDDFVEPASGFPLHPHRAVEILTYVLSGSLAHSDDMGNSCEVTRERIQLLTAGTGVMHSEFNPSSELPVRFLQIWLMPKPGCELTSPSYEHQNFPLETRTNALQAIASPDGEGGTLQITNDVRVFASQLTAQTELEHDLDENRRAWLQIAEGELTIDGLPLHRGDGVRIESEQRLRIRACTNCEFVLFDLP